MGDCRGSALRQEVAERIAVEASQLRRLADEAELPFLSYLIEMVVLEAWSEATGENAASQTGERDEATGFDR